MWILISCQDYYWILQSSFRSCSCLKDEMTLFSFLYNNNLMPRPDRIPYMVRKTLPKLGVS